MRNTFFTVLTFAIVLISPAISEAATRIDDPAKFVKSVYDRLAVSTPDKEYVAPDDIYTPRLAALWALERKESGGEVGRIDFDFWVNAQDWELKNINVSSQPVEGSNARKVIIAKFKNIGDPEEIHFYFEKSANGWLLDDARSVKGQAWTLSLILKYGWDGGN